MARIRTIKPEFWDSPSTAKAGPWARLLFIAMWNWADDWGIGDGSFSRLRSFAFPNDEVPVADFPRLVAEIHSAYGVVFFDHAGRRYYVIPSFDDHQRTEKRAKPRDELIEAARIACNDSEYQPSLLPTNPLVTDSPNSSADLPRGERGRGKGEVGTGEQGKGETRANARATPTDLPRVFVEFCDTYPGDVNTRPALAAWTAAVKRTDGRPQLILDGARAYAAHIAATGNYVRGAVKWLNEDGWLDKLKPVNGHSPPKSKLDPHVQLIQQIAANEQPAQRQIGAS